LAKKGTQRGGFSIVTLKLAIHERKKRKTGRGGEGKPACPKKASARKKSHNQEKERTSFSKNRTEKGNATGSVKRRKKPKQNITMVVPPGQSEVTA